MKFCKDCKWWMRTNKWNDDGKIPEYCAPCREPKHADVEIRRWAIFNNYHGSGFVYPTMNTGESGTCDAFEPMEEKK